MNIRFSIIFSLLIVSFHVLALAAPRKYVTRGRPPKRGICTICLENITAREQREHQLVNGLELFGCSEQHLFHRACLFSDGQLTTVQCPICRATKNPAAAATERAERAASAHPLSIEIDGQVLALEAGEYDPTLSTIEIDDDEQEDDQDQLESSDQESEHDSSSDPEKNGWDYSPRAFKDDSDERDL